MIEVISNTPLPTYFGGMESWQLDSHTVRAIALLSVRLMVGLLFIFQAYDRIFKIGLQAVANTFCAACGNGQLSKGWSYPLVLLNAWLELIAGVMLLTGFMVGLAASALCINLVMVTMVFSWAKPIWDETHVFVRLSLLILLMLAPPTWDSFAIDQLLL